MKNGWNFLIYLCFVYGILSCETSPKTPDPQEGSPVSSINTDSTPAPKTLASTETAIQTKLDTLVCQGSGMPMTDNNIWIKNEQLWITIAADSVTKSMDFGDSYRIMDVYDSRNCSLVSRHVLPVNNSPDFPWYIYPATYEKNNQVVCAQGFEFTYCYDVPNRKMLERMQPEFLYRRDAQDAQFGLPLGLTIYDQYLFGMGQDVGAYAFNLKNKKAITTFLPAAEFKTNGGFAPFNSLFFIPQGKDQYQAVIPALDAEGTVLEVQSLFKKPIKLNTTIAKNVRNNRFQIFPDLAQEGHRVIAIDMKQGKLIKLPDAIMKAKIGVVLDWLKKNVK